MFVPLWRTHSLWDDDARLGCRSCLSTLEISFLVHVGLVELAFLLVMFAFCVAMSMSLDLLLLSVTVTHNNMRIKHGTSLKNSTIVTVVTIVDTLNRCSVTHNNMRIKTRHELEEQYHCHRSNDSRYAEPLFCVFGWSTYHDYCMSSKYRTMRSKERGTEGSDIGTILWCHISGRLRNAGGGVLFHVLVVAVEGRMSLWVPFSCD
jgi:hypothetical protein